MLKRPIGHNEPPRAERPPMPRLILPLIAALAAGPALADPPVIEGATLTANRLSVTLSHPDTGWEHYANGWSVLTPDGTQIGIRPLAHPHVEEQPFTRSVALSDLPEGLSHLTITAACNAGNTSAPFRFDLTN